MKISIPITMTIYHDIEVSEDLDLRLFETDDKMVPIEIPKEIWDEHMASKIQTSNTLSKLLQVLFELRTDNPKVEAEITPCLGSVPPKEV